MPEIVPVSPFGRPAIPVPLRILGLLPALALLAAGLPSDLPAPMADGRMLGHLPYAEVSRTELVEAPRGFAVGQPCLINRDAAPDLARLLTAAALAPGVGRSLHAVSCFRAIAHQRAVFCHHGAPGFCPNPIARSRFVAPPSYSEHATGYALDFAVRPEGNCPDVDPCIAETAAGRWLLAHAPEYGFELSFPNGNPQGVTWEPWHWRWVGASINVAGAARARLTFARARANYPARPGVSDGSDAWLIASATRRPALSLASQSLPVQAAMAPPPLTAGPVQPGATPWLSEVKR